MKSPLKTFSEAKQLQKLLKNERNDIQMLFCDFSGMNKKKSEINKLKIAEPYLIDVKLLLEN